MLSWITRLRSSKQRPAARDLNGVPSEDALRRLYAELTPQLVRSLLAEFGQFVADRHGESTPASALPLPVPALELVFMKALREWPEGEDLERVRAMYVTLDEYLLSDDDYEALTSFRTFLKDFSSRDGEDDEKEHKARLAEELLQRMRDPRRQRATQLTQELAEKAARRFKIAHTPRV